MELKDLEKMTVVKLREEAHKFEVKDALGMSKEQLIDLLCEKLGIHRPEKKVVGVDKAALKARIRALKARRAQALAQNDHQAVADIRMRLKRYRRKIKTHIIVTT
jgi:hypothetical protein